MDDKELLELAAKAAGIKSRGFFVSESDGTGQLLGLVIDEHETRWWNPLRYDGDALRLAVKLHMFDAGNFMALRLEETRLNPARTDCEITRRAIVRAAAEIGKTL